MTSYGNVWRKWEHLYTLSSLLDHSIKTKGYSTDTIWRDWFEIGKGTRQGCILSPAAFNMYAEKVMRNAGLEDSSIGVRIGGRNINNLRYADDTTLMAESGKDLEDLVLLVKKESEKFGLYLNVKKTKIISTAATTTNISIKIEVVDDFIFLGAKMNRDDSHKIRKALLN
ncbi:Hypothetical predicted protein [Octopus vulgaris]|uniref:Reverse transcriptase domain-containing protein n=1 Tax=Octopus vulgaris TaxID=6645 RepID=A0AA36BAZ8_OCTVU|nr:Hypothetical predicted protein [Octopus vulgaris]